jgi:hypothetical protein
MLKSTTVRQRLAFIVALSLAVAHPGVAAALEAPASATRDAAKVDVQCGGTGDAPAINAALDEIRRRPVASGRAWPVGHAGRLRLSGETCAIRSTLDLTRLYGSGLALDFWGAQLLCQTDGRPCLDATGSGQISILGLNVVGDCKTATPNIGLAVARKTESLSAGADHLYIDHPTITGCFTRADYYNRSSETTLIVGGAFYNYQAHAYAAIWDGSNAFGFQSALVPEHYADRKFSSFNENTCDTCLFETFGAGATPLWIGGAVRHKFINGYVLGQAADGGSALILSFENSAPNDFLDLDIHFENRSLGSLILIRGTPKAKIHSLRLNDPMPFQSGPIFERDKGVEKVVIEDADFHIGVLSGNDPRWWDDKAAYSVSGAIYSQDGKYEDPNQISGLVCIGAKCALR